MADIHIDGSILEGGGQILRNSFSLAVLLKRNLHIVKIRAGRPKPGLRAQHLAGLQAAAALGGHLEDAEVGSNAVAFVPDSQGIRALKDHRVDIGTAGSIALIVQVTLPICLGAPDECSLRITGGSNVPFSPWVSYLDHVFKPLAQNFGMQFTLDIERHGFFPKGNGTVHLRTQPVQSFTPLELTEKGDLKSITGYAFFTNGKKDMGTRMRDTAQEVLQHRFAEACPTINIEIKDLDRQRAYGEGFGILLVASTTTGCYYGASALLERRKGRVEQVAVDACKFLETNLAHGGCVDEYGADQMILFMALAKGTSRLRTGPLSLHTKTSIEISKKITGATFNVTDEDDGTQIIECEGMGWERA